jgi:hypothetical protein
MMTRSELESLAAKVLRGDDNISGLDDATASRFLVARATGRSDVLSKTAAYIDAAMFDLARRHGVRVARLDDPARDPAPVAEAAPEASRAAYLRATEEAWKLPTLGAHTDAAPVETGLGSTAPGPKFGSGTLEEIAAFAEAQRKAFLRRTENAWRDPQVKHARADDAAELPAVSAPAELRADASLEALQAASEAARVRARVSAETAWSRPPAIASTL